ncbi:RNA exonuclease 4 [Phascolarctos cinereus]|uniref:RNA exonuclease 4 n=1 Tax=Phascolarctos cinereus TaxID=38626 RepID=A0A6P5JXW8_PHACI|nr:RNA exonuclease 4 [Phascolarctos cinereus]
MKAKAGFAKPSKGRAVAQPELVKKPGRKKQQQKREFWKRYPKAAAEASKKQGSKDAGAALPPRGPQEFSHNWRALQEILKQKTPNPEKSVPASPGNSRKQPKSYHQNGRSVSKKEEHGDAELPKVSGKIGQSSFKASISLGCLNDPKVVPHKKCNEAKGIGNGTETKKRKNGSLHQKRGDIKNEKRKAEELVPPPPTESDIWFDDVDPKDIEAAIGPEAAKIARKKLGLKERNLSLVKEGAFEGMTKAVAMDCEMVGAGPDGEENILARVSIVNQFGKCVYDKYVKPTEKVTDYRTDVSGIRPEDIRHGEEYQVVQKEVAELLKGRILVGHALHNDLKILLLDHPKKKIRDTQKYKPFRTQVKSGRPSLKLLSEKILGIKIQQSEHSSIQDAQAAMRLYVMVKKHWEGTIKDKYKLQKGEKDKA